MMANLWVNDEEFRALVDLQTELMTSRMRTENVNTIPHILHFIWLGSDLPDVYRKLIDGWQLMHPRWQLIIWNDDDANTFMRGGSKGGGDIPGSENMIAKSCLQQFLQASNYGMKSDILRYEILLELGGVYIDTDYECIKCLEDQDWWNYCMAFCGVSHSNALEVNNGLIGCTRNHPFFHGIVDVVSHLPLPNSIQTSTSDALSFARLSSVMSFLGEDSSTIASLDKNATSMKTISTTGPGMLTKQIFAFLNSSSAEESKMRTVILKTSVFHCVPNTTQANLADEDSVALLKTQWLTPDSVAVHWWQKSWQAQV